MFICAPSKFRSIISVSNLKIRGPLFSAPATRRWFRARRVIKICLPEFVVLNCGCNSAWGTKRSDLETGVFLEMASPKEIAEFSDDISRLSASLAELTHGAQGLAKVDVEKLESVRTPANLEEEELAGMGDVGKVEMVGTTEEVSDGNLNMGKNQSPHVTGKDEAVVGDLEEVVAWNGALTAGKSKEEETALDEVVVKIQSGYTHRKTEGIQDNVQEHAEQDGGQTAVGKLGATNEDNDEDRLENQREPGGKLKEDVAKAMTENNARKVSIGTIGKSEEMDIMQTEVGKVGRAQEDKDMGSFDSFRVPGGKLKEDAAKAIAERDIGEIKFGKAGKTAEDKDLGKHIVVRPNAQSKLEENVAKLEASFGPHSHAGIVGKTEGKEFVSTSGSRIEGDAPGKLETRADANVGKQTSQNAPSELEINVRKLEQSFGPDGHAGIVGKTEGKEFVSTSGSFIEGNEAPEKLGEGNESTMGKAESQSTPGKLQDNAEQAVSQCAAGKTEANKLGKGKTKPSEMPSTTESNVSGDLAINTAVEHKTGMTETYTLGEPGSGHVQCVILLASKGSEEAEYVEKLKSGDGLQLPDGAVVSAAASVTDASAREVFYVDLYLKILPTSKFGRLILYSPLIPSTHTLLSQNFHSFPAGTLCVAGAQLHGKGRAGNSWQSPKGCLMFSFTIQMTNGRQVPFLQYVVSLAVIEAVEENCKAHGIPSPDLKIKWPNDLYANGIKIGGVLCTSSYRAKTFNIVVGVGLNVGNREPTTCLDALIHDLDGQATAIQQEELLAAIMSKFESLNSKFQEQGFLPLQDTYYERWLHGGQKVVLEEKEPGSSSVSHVPVTIQGLTASGYLLATDDGGEHYELHPDGNSFDFLKGLVRQKLPA